MRYHLLPVRMDVIKNNTDKKCWQGCGEKGTVGRNINWASHCGKQCRYFSKNWKIEPPYDLAVQLLSIYQKKKKRKRKRKRSRLTDTENKLVVTSEEREEEGQLKDEGGKDVIMWLYAIICVKLENYKTLWI